MQTEDYKCYNKRTKKYPVKAVLFSLLILIGFLTRTLDKPPQYENFQGKLILRSQAFIMIHLGLQTIKREREREKKIHIWSQTC